MPFWRSLTRSETQTPSFRIWTSFCIIIFKTFTLGEALAVMIFNNFKWYCFHLNPNCFPLIFFLPQSGLTILFPATITVTLSAPDLSNQVAQCILISKRFPGLLGPGGRNVALIPRIIYSRLDSIGIWGFLHFFSFCRHFPIDICCPDCNLVIITKLSNGKKRKRTV